MSLGGFGVALAGCIWWGWMLRLVCLFGWLNGLLTCRVFCRLVCGVFDCAFCFRVLNVDLWRFGFKVVVSVWWFCGR